MSPTDPIPTPRSSPVRRPHLRPLAAALGVCLIVVGCATADGADEAGSAPATVSVEDATPTSIPSPPTAEEATSSSAPAHATAPAPEVWESRDLTRRTVASTPTPAPEPTVVPPTPTATPTPVATPPVTAPEPPPPPAPAPPELVVGDDGCVTDLTTGLVVTCYDPAAGPDEEPGTE
jgi:hypothetical protein